jgi:catechol-2,3-dioxygenase
VEGHRGAPGRALSATNVTGFSELTLEAREPGTLARFYEAGFGMEVIAREDDRVWLAAGERARLGLWTPGRKEFGDEGGAHVHFALTVAPHTLDSIGGRLRELGADVRGPFSHPGGDRSLYVTDPEGNVVEAWDLFERTAATVDEVRDEDG